jgi:hypothetical protein
VDLIEAQQQNGRIFVEICQVFGELFFRELGLRKIARKPILLAKEAC